MGRNARLLLLTWAAGSVDAISYLGLDHVFAAMMTGNTVLLGLAIAEAHILAALRSILALGGFSLGVAIGAWVAGRDQKQGDWPSAVTRAIALEEIILGLFAVTWHLTSPPRSPSVVYALIVLLSLAMGIQSAAVQRLGVTGVMTTYITGTLTSLVVGIVGRLRSTDVQSATARPDGKSGVPVPPASRREHRTGLLAAVFLVYGLGALVGGVLQARSSLVTLSPFVAVAVVLVNAAIRQRNRSS